MSYLEPAAIRRALSSKTWAVVGLTGHHYRVAYGVSAFLQDQGFRIVPVNPRAETVLGEKGYAQLSDIDFPIDVVDIFRRSDQAGQHVDEAIAI
ncbi:MAG: CoA-binding protein, partial [Nakamurella sp.]